MAKKTDERTELEKVIALLDDDGQYPVELLNPIQIGQTWARPGRDVVLKGKFIKQRSDDIASVSAKVD